MSPLSDRARAVLSAAQIAEKPHPQDKARIARRLGAVLPVAAIGGAAAGAVTGVGSPQAVAPQLPTVAVPPVPAGSAALAVAGGVTATAIFKVGLVVLVAGGGAVGGASLLAPMLREHGRRCEAPVVLSSSTVPSPVRASGVAGIPAGAAQGDVGTSVAGAARLTGHAKAPARLAEIQARLAARSSARAANRPGAGAMSSTVAEADAANPAPTSVSENTAAEATGAPASDASLTHTAPPSPAQHSATAPVPLPPKQTTVAALAPSPAAAAEVRALCDARQELALLSAAQQSLRQGDGPRALEQLQAHQRRCPHAQLAQERQVLRVLSLCLMHDVEAARQVARALVKTPPSAPQLRRLRDSCAADALR